MALPVRGRLPPSPRPPPARTRRPNAASERRPGHRPGLRTGEEHELVEPQELDEIAPRLSQTIEITGFVDLDTVDPVFFDKTYYLGPRDKEY
ncbi:Ku protein [Streptomyces sp. NPDC086989]|uniref:Ku protein n=1 Tax=Streptomyces sp. NPDC086989 TaxID=3365764 RepID=UPI00383053A1